MRTSRFCGFGLGPGSRLPRLLTEFGFAFWALTEISCELKQPLDAVTVTKAVQNITLGLQTFQSGYEGKITQEQWENKTE